MLASCKCYPDSVDKPGTSEEAELLINGQSPQFVEPDSGELGELAVRKDCHSVQSGETIKLSYSGATGVLRWEIEGVQLDNPQEREQTVQWSKEGFYKARLNIDNDYHAVCIHVVGDAVTARNPSTEKPVQSKPGAIVSGVKPEEKKHSPATEEKTPFSTTSVSPKISDSDGDGVPDDQDHCPNKTGPRDNNGCPKTAAATPVTLLAEKPGSVSNEVKSKTAVVEEDEDFTSTGRAGIRGNKCIGAVVISQPSTRIRLTPAKSLSLSYLKVWPSRPLRVNISITEDGGGNPRSLSGRQLNAGAPCEINFETIDYVLRAGKTYVVTITATDGSIDVFDFSDCNTTDGNSGQLIISYGPEGKAVFDVKYKY